MAGRGAKGVIEMDSYENNRWYPIRGWTGGLLPTDRHHYSSEDGKEERRRDKIPLPPAYRWINEWTVVVNHPSETDEDGWMYAVDFPREYQPQMSSGCFVRRRKWVRKMAPKSPEVEPLSDVLARAPPPFTVPPPNPDPASKKEERLHSSESTAFNAVFSNFKDDATNVGGEEPEYLKRLDAPEADEAPIERSDTVDFNAVYAKFLANAEKDQK